MSLRDELPGAGKRKDAPPPQSFYRSNKCELRGCACNGRGKAEVVIQDQNKQPVGYVCQLGYYNHLRERQLDQWHTWRPTGAQLKPVQHTMADHRGMRQISELVSELDRYADNVHDRENDDG